MLKSIIPKRLKFDEEKNSIFSDDLIHTMLRMQLKMTELMKINNFDAQLGKQLLQTFRNIYSPNKKLKGTCLLFFTESISNHNHKLQTNISGINLLSIPMQNTSPLLGKKSTSRPEERLARTPST